VLRAQVPLARRHAVIVTLRDPVERMRSAYRYAYDDIGQPGIPAEMHLRTTAPTIDHFLRRVSASASSREKLLRAMTFWPMHRFLGGGPFPHVLCVSPAWPPLHEQLGAIIGQPVSPIDIENETRNLSGTVDNHFYLTCAHYHTTTTKFPNHIVGVPSAGSLLKSESSFGRREAPPPPRWVRCAVGARGGGHPPAVRGGRQALREGLRGLRRQSLRFQLRGG
jgi:hypothetical protein